MGAVKNEITNDPESFGYSGMTPEQIYVRIYVTEDRPFSVPVNAWDVLDVLSFDSVQAWSQTADAGAKAAWTLLALAIQSGERIDVVGDKTFNKILNKARQALPSAVITAAEKNAAEVLCQRTVTRAVEKDLPLKYPADIARIVGGLADG